MIFLLILLERTLRHLSYLDLNDSQKQWALRTAASLACHLRKRWDCPVQLDCGDLGATIPECPPAALSSRFGSALWSVQPQFTDLTMAWGAAHSQIAQNRDVILQLKMKLVQESEESKERNERHAQVLCDWLSQPNSERGMKILPELTEQESSIVGAAVKVSHRACWDFFVSTMHWEGRPSEGCYPLLIQGERAWLYRPGQQLLIKDSAGHWNDASVIDMCAHGKYRVQMYSMAEQRREERELLLTQDNHVVSAYFCYDEKTQLCVYTASGKWADATVCAATGDNNVHRITIQGETSGVTNLVLNPFNHCLLRISVKDYVDALRNYRKFVITRHGFITDALTGERLGIEDQIIKLELIDTAAGIAGGHDRLMSMAKPLFERQSDLLVDQRVLIEAEAAAGKTVMMRQVIHHCCKWNHRDENDTVPILVLVIDLQRSMTKFADDYGDAADLNGGRVDLVAVYLRLTYQGNNDARFHALMQVTCVDS